MPRRILSRLFCLLSALPLAACGGGGGGDSPPKPLAEEYGACPHLSASIGAASWENLADKSSEACQYPSDAKICGSGLTLTAIDTFDETGSGAIGDYYVQDTVDDPPPFSGATIFGPSFSPPDLRLFNGDVVDFLGTKSEFAGPSSGPFSYCRTLPELGGTISFRFDGSGTLTPKTIPLSDLITGAFDPKQTPTSFPTSYNKARGWLGMLVRVENVDLATGSNSSGRFSAKFISGVDADGMPIGTSGVPTTEVPVIANELYDIETRGPALTAPSTHFKSITGVVTYFYGFHLDPRSPEDFEQ